MLLSISYFVGVPSPGIYSCWLQLLGKISCPALKPSFFLAVEAGLSAVAAPSTGLSRAPQTEKYAVVGECRAISHEITVPKGFSEVPFTRYSLIYVIIPLLVFTDLGGTQILVEEGRWYTCNRLQVCTSLHWPQLCAGRSSYLISLQVANWWVAARVSIIIRPTRVLTGHSLNGNACMAGRAREQGAAWPRAGLEA
jgi:hypothetical protein